MFGPALQPCVVVMTHFLTGEIDTSIDMKQGQRHQHSAGAVQEGTATRLKERVGGTRWMQRRHTYELIRCLRDLTHNDNDWASLSMSDIQCTMRRCIHHWDKT